VLTLLSILIIQLVSVWSEDNPLASITLTSRRWSLVSPVVDPVRLLVEVWRVVAEREVDGMWRAAIWRRGKGWEGEGRKGKNRFYEVKKM